ncbi:ABC transporter ATP-binding protein [Plantibacter sp. PA-3-X8]|uniref:ABC transporter ATP-binding protein n=1 Tax=unclassified Plantibacter TaxID=2624265 RepID=UPI000F5FB63A|nr:MULTISPECIES: ABC transporter ATP-binding protein [unclassified Plantibacter]AZH82745.1 ABC transporter ATP-binding protein [Plantibacter sp. PA-3-X8]MBD8535009.1 ABC transporter ATP-binding protein [Plantibacter sp. CFBP 13570]
MSLEARDLSFGYSLHRREPVHVLRGVSLSVAAGESLAVVGPSGSGKSTLLHCLSGLRAPTRGSVVALGTELSSLTEWGRSRFRRRSVGFVFQDYNLIPSINVRDNLALPALFAGRAAGRQAVADIAADIGLSSRLRHRPDELSGGERQRVAIGRVLLSQAELVFADEPTGALDTSSGRVVLDLLFGSLGPERTMVMVTHDLDAAARADRVLVLCDGSVHAELTSATPAALWSAIETARADSVHTSVGA